MSDIEQARIERDLAQWAAVEREAMAMRDRALKARADLWRRYKEAGGEVPEHADAEYLPWASALEKWRAEGCRRGFRKGQEDMRERAAGYADGFDGMSLGCGDGIRALPIEDQ